MRKKGRPFGLPFLEKSPYFGTMPLVSAWVKVNL